MDQRLRQADALLVPLREMRDDALRGRHAAHVEIESHRLDDRICRCIDIIDALDCRGEPDEVAHHHVAIQRRSLRQIPDGCLHRRRCERDVVAVNGR